MIAVPNKIYSEIKTTGHRPEGESKWNRNNGI